MGDYKISFCTVCMNRLHHLKQTLPINLINNENYFDLEFIVLDYNSSDGLESYIKESMGSYLQSGRLVYYKTLSPKYFNRSHSRNLVFNLSNGNIICNIDADNFTGVNFAKYINDQFKTRNDIFLTTIGNSNSADVLGRICMKKKDFLEIKGYDERMTDYGFEDYDLVNRLEINGLKKVFINSNAEYLRAIKHGNEERLSNEFVTNNIKSLLLSYLTPSSTCFIFIFNNHKYKKFILIDTITFEPLTEIQKAEPSYNLAFFQDQWAEGEWGGDDNELIINQKGHPIKKLNFNKKKNCFESFTNNLLEDYYPISNKFLIQEAIFQTGLITNRILMDKNKLEKRDNVNLNGFGKDTVYRNFENKIHLVP
ncbi:glycosyltransferase family 2 protein [Pedobacter cryoconitis]|uniref:Glycosyl transferase family 2 n=1 Tax=Pedobacter cryoconitis TaxID=188932 RepID=A0A7X0J8I6_9SPHI|nr:glycosyltransferase family A protein [Pedobacter cryoconitis]MBB6503023.1 hypothetical protein [Pedobacter cryoconitis]